MNNTELILKETGLVGLTRQFHQSNLTPFYNYLLSQTSSSRTNVKYTLQILARLYFGVHVDAEFAPWHTVTSVTVLALCEQIRDKKLIRKAKTANRYLSVTKGIMREVYLAGQISPEEYERIKGIRGRFGSNKTKGRALSEAETRQLLQLVKQDQSIYGIRDTAIIAIYIACGIRRSELLNLTLKDFNFRKNNFTIIAKGKKEIEVPMPPMVLVYINRWIDYFRGDEPGPLFNPIHKSNEQPMRMPTGELAKISPRALNNMITRRLVKYDIEHASPHDFRRTFTVRRFNKGENIKTLQNLLGHQSVATTAIYIKTDNKDMIASASRDDILIF